MSYCVIVLGVMSAVYDTCFSGALMIACAVDPSGMMIVTSVPSGVTVL